MNEALTLIGYFPKRITPADPAMALPGVREIWSVSTCITGEPDGWIQQWKHNDLWAFDTPALAASIVPASEAAAHVIVAYRMLGREFTAEGERDIAFPPALAALSLEPGYDPIGFDVVSWDHGSPGCSPLSCNGAAKTFPVNDRCLFATLEQALSAAHEFATGNWEPPPYRVVQVLAPGAATRGRG